LNFEMTKDVVRMTVQPGNPPPPASPTARPPRVAVGPSPEVRAGSVLQAIREGAPVTSAVHPSVHAHPSAVDIRGFELWYGSFKALHSVSMPIPRGRVTAMVGPSGCGKSTLLRSINRMNDLVDGVRTTGAVHVGEHDVYAGGVDVISIRRRVGMVFQKSNPFPMSIFDNVVYGLRIYGERRKDVLQECCERALRQAALWDEVKDRLKQSAIGLSGGQQQRLCIARSIAVNPEVLLMDEPCSALDPIATQKIEELIREIAEKLTVVIVTHNMQQAARVSNYTAFMYLGRLVEFGTTADIFQNPQLPETEQYVTGRFG
jgi:phosphate transport system ATP-binding protein